MKTSRPALVRAALAFGTILLFGCGGYGGGNGSTPATLSISVNPTTITVGQSATITWNSNGGTCTASGAWTGAKAASGSEQVTPAAAGTYTYSLRCGGGGYGESDVGSATLTVNAMRAAGLWMGEACCVDANAFRVSGMTSEAGDYRFLLLGSHFVGRAGEAPAAYATSRSSLAGQRLADAPTFALLDITPRVAVRQWLRSAGPKGQPVDFSVPYDRAFERATSNADLAGSYTSHLGTGYTLTLTIDGAGQVTGADTNGCRLDGRAANGLPAVNTFDLVLDVSSCGRSNGRYSGKAALIDDDTGKSSGLLVSASNTDSAIGWQLTR